MNPPCICGGDNLLHPAQGHAVDLEVVHHDVVERIPLWIIRSGLGQVCPLVEVYPKVCALDIKWITNDNQT